MKTTILLGLAAITAGLLLGPQVNGLVTEDKSLRHLAVEATAQTPELLNEDGSASESASGSESDNELYEDGSASRSGSDDNELDEDGSASRSGSDDDETHEDGSASRSGSDDNELYQNSDTSAVCRPGTSNWPACRSIGYPGCMPGVVRWPQCKNDPTRD